LFLGGAIETISQGGPRSRRSLASVVALVLAASFFVFFGGEARAQQSPQQQPHMAVADGNALKETVEEVAGMAAEAPPPGVLPSETPLAEMLPAEAFPVSVAPPVGYDLVPAEPALWQDPTPAPLYRYDVGMPPGLAPERGIPGDPGTTREPLPRPEAVPPPSAVERPTVNTPATSAHPVTGTVRGAPGAGPVVSTPSAPGSLAVGYQPPLSPENASGNLQNVVTNTVDDAVGAHAAGGEYSPATSLSGAGDASESTPRHERQQSSPLAPLGGSSFSLSGGQAGPGGGLTPLLVCVLASVLILLRRDGLLFRWAPFEPPKPGSALLLPLERPG
jgi:hypothetical protein